MIGLRMFHLNDGGWLLALRGAIDDASVEAAVHELAILDGADVIVDLMNAQIVDLDALDSLVAAAGIAATFVAERPIGDALRLIGLRRYVHVEPTLAAALN